jgi:hypothetical protein
MSRQDDAKWIELQLRCERAESALAEAHKQIADKNQALQDIAHWRQRCHNYDEDMDHDPRPFVDEEEWDRVEADAARAAKGEPMP